MLVVHGIGDALMSVDLGVVQLRSLVECCDTMRAHHEEVRRGRERSRSFETEKLRWDWEVLTAERCRRVSNIRALRALVTVRTWFALAIKGAPCGLLTVTEQPTPSSSFLVSIFSRTR